MKYEGNVATGQGVETINTRWFTSRSTQDEASQPSQRSEGQVEQRISTYFYDATTLLKQKSIIDLL